MAINYLNALMANRFLVGEQNCARGDRWKGYFEPIPELSHDLPVPFLGVMLLIWQLRNQDLQKRYPLKTKESRLEFIGWCIVHGRKEYRVLQQAKRLWDSLNELADLTDLSMVEDDPAYGISWMLVLIAKVRVDLKVDISNLQGRESLLVWYLLHGRNELGLSDEPLPDWQIRFLLSGSTTMPGLNRIQALLYKARPDVAQVFPLHAGHKAYIAWFRSCIMVEAGMMDAFRISQLPIHKLIEPQATLPFGVNVIGYAYGELGIGEDARMAAHSLLAAGVPMTMINFSPGRNISQTDISMADHVGEVATYSINIFCVSALEHGRYFAECGSVFIEGRYNIGYWPWELSQWPSQWLHLFALVDEVWVSSQHTFDAISTISPVPVRIMPMAVIAKGGSQLRRKAFGLPQKTTLFLFAFDLSSSANRKNPGACIKAFLAAFPIGSPHNVGLVIKVHPPKDKNEEWETLKELRKYDSRIYIIEKTLSKADLLALYRVCDCFVSLHRAEGFGRCIAEAMLLGKPVITTNYSGNLAFNDETNALMVNYKLIPLAENDYPYGDGQCWAEPDVLDAARKMQLVLFGGDSVARIAALGKVRIRNSHNPKYIGQNYAKVLRTIE